MFIVLSDSTRVCPPTKGTNQQNGNKKGSATLYFPLSRPCQACKNSNRAGTFCAAFRDRGKIKVQIFFSIIALLFGNTSASKRTVHF